MTLRVGCLPNLPRTFTWSGTIRATSAGGVEIVISVPFAFISNETHAATLIGNSFSFTADFDSLYSFVATLSADRRSLNGTFVGGNCNVPPTIVLPSGTWTGTHQ